MGQTSLSTYKNFCDTDHDLEQSTLILLTQKFPLGNTIATKKVHKLFHFFNVNPSLRRFYVMENQFFERIPIYNQNKQTTIFVSSNR